MTTISLLMLFREINALYSENHTKPINTLCGQMQLIVKASGTYISHWDLKDSLYYLYIVGARVAQSVQ
jgi:hypothetical protein